MAPKTKAFIKRDIKTGKILPNSPPKRSSRPFKNLTNDPPAPTSLEDDIASALTKFLDSHSTIQRLLHSNDVLKKHEVSVVESHIIQFEAFRYRYAGPSQEKIPDITFSAIERAIRDLKYIANKKHNRNPTTFPREVFRLFMQFVAESNVTVYPFSQNSTMGPVRIALVCKAFYQGVKSTPAMWANIVLSNMGLSSAKPFPSKAVELVKALLKRSKSEPLRLKVRMPMFHDAQALEKSKAKAKAKRSVNDERDAGRAIMRLLISHCQRWTVAEFELSPAHMAMLDTIDPEKLLLLQSMYLKMSLLPGVKQPLLSNLLHLKKKFRITTVNFLQEMQLGSIVDARTTLQMYEGANLDPFTFPNLRCITMEHRDARDLIPRLSSSAFSAVDRLLTRSNAHAGMRVLNLFNPVFTHDVLDFINNLSSLTTLRVHVHYDVESKIIKLKTRLRDRTFGTNLKKLILEADVDVNKGRLTLMGLSVNEEAFPKLLRERASWGLREVQLSKSIKDMRKDWHWAYEIQGLSVTFASS